MTQPMLFINGTWCAGKGPVFTSINPATGAIIWEGAAATTSDVDAAMSAARAAFPAWAGLSVEARLAYLQRFRGIVEKNKQVLAECVSKEMGKPLWDALVEIGSMIGKLDVTVKAFHERTPEKHGEYAGTPTVLRHRPHGVVAVYGPYNFPAHLPNGHIMPALLAGNTVVLKPSEQAPMVSEQIVRFWQEAELPPGVLNLVQGEQETGKALASHPGIDGLFFTGSSDVGILLHQQFAHQPWKILALEMGGNNPLVVHEISDFTAAAHIIILSAYMSAGQRCSCARRLILPVGKESDQVLEALMTMMKTIKVGPYTDTPEPYMGPLISPREAERLMAAQEELTAAGGKPLVKMQRLHDKLPFLSAGLIDVTAIKNLPDREYFGPLLQVIRTPDFVHAVEEANNTSFGLTSALLSDKREHFDYFWQHIRAGVANWNRQTTGASATAPFGGLGKSGNHRPSAYYAADYCAYPMASMELPKLQLPATPPAGLSW